MSVASVCGPQRRAGSHYVHLASRDGDSARCGQHAGRFCCNAAPCRAPSLTCQIVLRLCLLFVREILQQALPARDCVSFVCQMFAINTFINIAGAVRCLGMRCRWRICVGYETCSQEGRAGSDVPLCQRLSER